MKQKTSDKYQAIAQAFNFVGSGKDKLTLTMGHEEVVQCGNPAEVDLVIDITVTMTPGEAKALADVIYSTLKAMGTIGIESEK